MYWISIQHVKLKWFRGYDVPFTLQVWLHYPGGSRRWFNLWGPVTVQWLRERM